MAEIKKHVGVIGATSFVGGCLLPLLTEAGFQVTAFSRKLETSIHSFSRQAVVCTDYGVKWQQLSLVKHKSTRQSDDTDDKEVTPYWICVAPIWALIEHFALLEAKGVRRVVVLSSTSRFTKDDSTDPKEQAMSRRMAEAEACLQKWAESRNVEWVILRPTLIYGLGKDKNITEIARFIRRFGFFPLLGRAGGLRQPVHAVDVAGACLAALQSNHAANRAYNISGGEILSYRTMVVRVFNALGCRPRLLSVPLWSFRLAVALLRCLPRYRQWSASMAERMNRDLVFDHSEAARDLSFKPRAFLLSAADVAAQAISR